MNKFQPKGALKVVKGSILNPESAGLRFVLNPINTAGSTKSPLFDLFDKKWTKAKVFAKELFATRTGAYKLGSGFIQDLATQSDVWIINMLCQDDKLQTDAASLEACIKNVAKLAKAEKATIHVSSLMVKEMPQIQTLCQSYFVDNGISVSFYQDAGVELPTKEGIKVSSNKEIKVSATNIQTSLEEDPSTSRVKIKTSRETKRKTTPAT